MVKIVERITTAAIKTLMKFFPYSVEDVKEAFYEQFDTIFTDPVEELSGKIEELFTQIMQETTDKIVKELEGHSPITPAKAAEIQLTIAGISLAANTLGTTISVLGEVAGVGQVETHSDWMHHILDGLGIHDLGKHSLQSMVKHGVDIPVDYHWASTFMPQHPPLSDTMLAYNREKISRGAFDEILSLQGIYPDKELPEPKKVLRIPPEAWKEGIPDITKIELKPVEVKTYGDMYDEIRKGAAGYFLLSMAARSGFYDRDLFENFLLDSDYGPEVSALALKAFESAFIRRHKTKREDMIIEDFLEGRATKSEFYERFKAMEYTEDMIDVIFAFFEDAKAVRTRHVSAVFLRKQFISGAITEPEYQRGLARLRYAKADINLIVEDAKSEIEGIEYAHRSLSKTDVLRMYKAKIRDKATVTKNLLGMGIDKKDVEDLMKMYEPTEKT